MITGELKNGKTLKINTSFYDDIKSIINESRKAAVRSVDFQRVVMYWHLGERIFVEEQQGGVEERISEITILVVP